MRIAVDAIRAAWRQPYVPLPDKNGQMTIYQTSGNPYGDIINAWRQKTELSCRSAAGEMLHEFD
ncbi:hypothetical protein ACNKHX_09315 [Shigella flexneri]